MKKKSERHHHFSVLRQFRGRRLGTAAEKGGRYPIREMYFRNDATVAISVRRWIFDPLYFCEYIVVKEYKIFKGCIAVKGYIV